MYNVCRESHLKFKIFFSSTKQQLQQIELTNGKEKRGKMIAKEAWRRKRNGDFVCSRVKDPINLRMEIETSHRSIEKAPRLPTQRGHVENKRISICSVKFVFNDVFFHFNTDNDDETAVFQLTW